MTPAELKTLIDSDTEAAHMAGIGDDSGCAARCSAIAPTIRKPIPAAKVQEIATLNGLWGVLVIAAGNAELTNPPRGVAVNFVTWIEKGFPLNPDSVPVQQMAAALMAYNLATAEQIAEISEAADSPQTISPAAVSEAMFATRYPGGM